MDDEFDGHLGPELDDVEPAPKQRKVRPDYEPNIVSEAAADICEVPGEEPKQYWIRENFVLESPRSNYLIVGFDTEYQQLDSFLDAAAVREGKAKYEPLSYQFYAIHSDGTSWEGIAVPPEGDRMALSDFMVLVLAKGAEVCSSVPQNIILVGHFNKADVPAFEERKPILRRLTNIQNSLISQNVPVRLRLRFSEAEDHHIDLAIYVRDTMLLAPAGKKSLAELGKLIGISKIRLADNESDETNIKENMKALRSLDWETFRRYAIVDAEISARYFQQVSETYKSETASKFVPTALSSIGMKLLVQGWGDRAPYIVGRETITEEIYDEFKGHIITVKRLPYIEEVHWNINFATECYHGGRNEQFWFGPSFEDHWTDYDLKGAYPTAMALIGCPDWHAIREAGIDDLAQDTLGFACVDFKFPTGTRYPTLPVRSQNGIIFPLEGRSYCSSPEIALAKSLGCDLSLKRAILVPQNNKDRVFFPFIKGAIERRQSAQSEIEQAFWKECANACYGKTAQGLNDKRVFSLKRQANQKVPPSAITNPFFSGYITSFVRATVGEVMNALPDDKMVFSVTTDGFITNATEKECANAQRGSLSRAFSKCRKSLTGKGDVLEEKHKVRQLLGWRTRGQATLKTGGGKIVLAKAGIKPRMSATEPAEQNQYILETFFERTATSTIDVDFFTSVREMVLYDADLVRKRQVRRFSMEFDFKRKPISAVMAEVEVQRLGKVDHLAFETAPWKSIAEFNRARKLRDHHWANNRNCLKTTADYGEFAGFFDMMEDLGPQFGLYLRKINGPLFRLRRDLCRAFKHGKAGLDHYKGMSAQQFAQILNESGMEALGVSTKRADVENGLKAGFTEGTTPPTGQVLRVLAGISEKLPHLDAEAILASPSGGGIDLSGALTNLTPFTSRLTGYCQ